MKKHPVVEALEKASKGLQMPSESDAPFKAFVWANVGPKMTPDRVRELAKADKGTTVETSTLDDLLQTVPSESKDKFDALAATIKQQLSEVKVYKIGDEAEKQVYIVGKTQDGQWAGLQTAVVET